MNHVRQFLDGFASLFGGLRLVCGNSRVRIFAIIPFLIYALVLYIAIQIGIANIPFWVSWMSLSFGAWLANPIIATVLAITFWIVFLLASALVVFLLAGIIASPFYALLAETGLEVKGVKSSRPFQFFRWVRTAFKMIGVALIKGALFLVIGAVLLLLSFIPVLNIFTSFCVVFMLSLDCLDYSFEAMEMGFRERWRFVRSHWIIISGFATGLGLTLLVPGLNFLLLPAAVAGGVEMVARSRGRV